MFLTVTGADESERASDRSIEKLLVVQGLVGMLSAPGGGEPSEAGAQKEAANCASTTGADTRYNDEETPPDSEALWSLSCGSPTMRRSSVSRQRRLTKEIEAAPVLLRTIASKEKEGGSPGSLLRRALSGSASANASGR